VGRLRLPGLCLAAAFTGPALAQDDCPAAIARDLENERPACQLLAEGQLVSSLANADLTYRLYRWVSATEGEPSPLADHQPYNNTAVTISRADGPGQPPFWSAHYWPGTAWFETPYLARHPEYGEFLVVPSRYAGTGGFTEDHVFMPSQTHGWTRIRSAAFDPETGKGWLDGLKAGLPPGHGIWKGIRVDYTTLTGTTAVWRDSDANCCPSGGELWFRLRITGPDVGFEVAETRYAPPPQ
jgi:hypothetical protein